MALTVAQAFTVAFELWQVAKEGRHHTLHAPHPGNQTNKKQSQSMEELFLSATETAYVCTESVLNFQGRICCKVAVSKF